MTREQLIRDFFVEKDYDILICKNCICAVESRGEKCTHTSGTVVDLDDLEEFIEDGGLEEAEDGDEPCGCEWCGEVDDLYGVFWL